MSNSFIFDLYGKLFAAHRNSPVVSSRDIVNKIGIVGLSPQSVISEMVGAGLLTQVGTSSFRINSDKGQALKINEKIEKASKNLLETVSNDSEFETHGLGESQYANAIREADEIPASDSPAPVAEPEVAKEVEIPVASKASKLQDSLSVSTSYVAPNDMEAQSVTSEIKAALIDKAAKVEVSLSSINPYAFTVAGDPGDVSIAEFYLTTVMFNVLGDKTDAATLKIKKERKTQIVS